MQTIERTILTALLRDMRAAGYQPAAVWDSEDYVMADPADLNDTCSVEPPLDEIVRPLTDAEVLDHLDAVDAICTVHFTHQGKRTWGNRGVMVVLGNGTDVISDYHCADGEPFGDVIDAIYERIEKGALV